MTLKKNILILVLILSSLVLIFVQQYFFNAKQSSSPQDKKEKEVQEFHIEINDHKFYPDVIEAKSGQKIRLIVKNNDDIAEEFESHDLAREKMIAPHQSVKIILAPLAPGNYKFFGEFHAHSAHGILKID